MGVLRRIEDLVKKSFANTVDFAEAEKALRLKQQAEALTGFEYFDGGFIFHGPGGLTRVSWNEIVRIITFKEDRFTYDVICLRLIWEDNVLTLREETRGWDEFVERMNATLPVAPKWEEEAMLPPFATNETVIYEKPAK